jgi:ADP-heptose:LPS heptosyltransferase
MISEAMQDALDPNVKRVLVIMNDHHLGNTVISLPILEALSAYFQSDVDFLIDGRYAPLLQRLPSHPTLIHWPNRHTHPGGMGRAWAEFCSVLKLRRHRYDVSIDLMGMLRSTRITRWVAAGRRYGFGHLRNPHVYSDHVGKPDGPHCFDRYAQFLNLVNQAPPPMIQLTADPKAVASMTETLHAANVDETEPLIVIHPSSAKSYRRWPAERFAAVADGLVESHVARICIIGTRGETRLMDELIGKMRHGARAIQYFGDVGQLLALFHRASLLVSSESGPTHLASTTPVPIVTIFGPSDENEWRPLRDNGLTVLRGAACDTACHPARCQHDYRCLMHLDAAQTLAASRAALDAAPSATDDSNAG